MLFDDAKHSTLKLTFVAFLLAKVKYKFWIKSILLPLRGKVKVFKQRVTFKFVRWQGDHESVND